MKKILFGIVNAILIAIVGLLVGVFCGENIFVDAAGLGAFICFLVSLAVPSVIYYFSDLFGNAINIDMVLLIAAELIANIYFMCKPASGIKAFAITQACILGLYLIALLIIIGLTSKKESK